MGSRSYEQVLGLGEWPYGERQRYVVTGRELARATERVEFVPDGIETLSDIVRLSGRSRFQRRGDDRTACRDAYRSSCSTGESATTPRRVRPTVIVSDGE